MRRHSTLEMVGINKRITSENIKKTIRVIIIFKKCYKQNKKAQLPFA